MINPNVVEGQIAGGTVQGIGGVLLEHLAYDEDGNPLTTTFMDYLLPTTAEVPDDRVRPRRDARPRAPAATRAWARAARSARRPRSSTPSPTRSRPLGVTHHRAPPRPLPDRQPHRGRGSTAP